MVKQTMPKVIVEENSNVPANQRHIKIYDRLLDNVEYLLEGFSKDVASSEFDFTDIPKSTISTLDFLVASIVKIQKGHRIALGLDDEEDVKSVEPEISIIQGIDISKV